MILSRQQIPHSYIDGLLLQGLDPTPEHQSKVHPLLWPAMYPLSGSIHVMFRDFSD